LILRHWKELTLPPGAPMIGGCWACGGLPFILR
jgi:hypothetical protein